MINVIQRHRYFHWTINRQHYVGSEAQRGPHLYVCPGCPLYGKQLTLLDNAIPLLFLVDAELPLSIIGGCFPTCFYLARRWMKYGAASMFSINTPSTQPNYRVDRQYSPSNRRLRPGYESFSMETKSSDTKPSVYTGSDTQFDVAATRSAPDSDAGVGDDRHLQGIMVSNDFQVVSSDKL